MKILLTGVFGNIGNHTNKQLLEHKYTVLAFNVKKPNNLKAAKDYADKIEVIWGDIRKPESVNAAVVQLTRMRSRFYLSKINDHGTCASWVRVIF